MIDKDEVGQTLIPDDIILEDETSGFLACKATVCFTLPNQKRRKAYKDSTRGFF